MVVTEQARQEKAAEQEKILKELALQTRNWARHIGAYIHPETEEHGYFTVDEWKAHFEKSQAVWRRVKHKMVELGYPITFDASGVEGGHFLGKPGSQMISVAALVKGIRTQSQTIFELLDAAHTSGHWDECLEVLTESLEGNKHHLAVEDITSLLKGMGLSLRHDLRQMQFPKTQPEGNEN